MNDDVTKHTVFGYQLQQPWPWENISDCQFKIFSPKEWIPLFKMVEKIILEAKIICTVRQTYNTVGTLAMQKTRQGIIKDFNILELPQLLRNLLRNFHTRMKRRRIIK